MILIDYKDRRPIYEQVTEKLGELMLRGVLAQGSQLPSVRSLAMELSINPNTIQRAYAGAGAAGLHLLCEGEGEFRVGERPHAGGEAEGDLCGS